MRIALLLPALVIGLAVPTVIGSETGRVFRSKDGSKSLRAELVSVDPVRKTIRLKTPDARVIDAPLSAFSEEAAEHAREFLALQELGRRLGLRFEELEGTTEEKKIPSKGQAVFTTPTGYLINARNNGHAPMEDFKLDYQIFYSEDVVNGGRATRLASGSLSVDRLVPQEEKDLATSQVDIVRMKKLPASECSGGT